MSQFTIVDTAGTPRIVNYGRRGIILDTESLGFIYADTNLSPDQVRFVRWLGATSASYLVATGSNLATICTVDRFTDGTLLAGVRNITSDDWEFYRSSDKGETWSIATLDPFPAGGTDFGTIAIDERNQVYAFPEINQVSFPYISVDSGSTWNFLSMYGAASPWGTDRGFCYYNPVAKHVVFAQEGSTNNPGRIAIYNPFGTTDTSGSISGSWYYPGGSIYYFTANNWWFADLLGGTPAPSAVWHDDTGRDHIVWLLENAGADCVIEETWAVGEDYPVSGSIIFHKNLGIDITQFTAKRDLNGVVHFFVGNNTQKTILHMVSQSFGGAGYPPSGSWTAPIVGINAAVTPWNEFITLDSCYSGTFTAGTYNIAGLLVTEADYTNGLIYASQDFTGSFIVSASEPPVPPVPTGFLTFFELRNALGNGIYTQGSGTIRVQTGYTSLLQ